MIVVCSADEDLLGQVGRAVEQLGYEWEMSRGEEQVVFALSGHGDPEELEEALLRLPGVDLIPILSGKDYWRIRARRRFMTGLSSGLGLLIAVGAGVPIVGFLLPPKESLSAPSLVHAANVDQIPENAAKLVRLYGKPVLLVRAGGERYFALSAICTHMAICQLDWDQERHQLICPCHGGAFDVYGNVVQGPAAVPLATYPVERLGENLYIRREG